MKTNRCVFCSSPAYGRGCRYGPKNTHFHPDDSTRCSWCGSPAYGPGCRLNPNGKEHVHGISYNVMINDSIQNRSLLKNLKKEFKDFQAYKIGIINEKGDKIKEPVTEQEKAAYSPETKTILKIKKYLGAKLDLIEHTRLLENTSKLHYDKENHKKLLQFEDKFTNILAQLDKITCEALVEGVTMEQVQAMLQQ